MSALLTYAGLVGAAAVTARATRASLPTLGVWDTACLALATYKGARLIAKDKVTAPLRAPFARREGNGAGPEVNDAPAGRGPRAVVGELLTCPFCLGQWIATGFAVGLIFAPRATRLVTSTLAANAGADFLHYAFTTVQHLPDAVAARAAA